MDSDRAVRPQRPYTAALRVQVIGPPALLSLTQGNLSLPGSSKLSIVPSQSFLGADKRELPAGAARAHPVWLSMGLCVARASPAPVHTIRLPEDLGPRPAAVHDLRAHSAGTRACPERSCEGRLWGVGFPWTFALAVPSARKGFPSASPTTCSLLILPLRIQMSPLHRGPS